MSASIPVHQPVERTAVATSLILLLVMIAMIAGFAQRPQFEYTPPSLKKAEKMIDAKADPKGHERQFREREINERFQQALAMLHAGQFQFAVTALQRVIELSPGMAEAYVNMGFAYFGLEQYEEAKRYFNQATEIRPYQANAYWGMAVTLEKLNDIEGALGAMRSFIHLSPPNDPFLRRARSALWEWESRLKRGPLPEAEKKWIDRRSKEWQERNGPEADAPKPESQSIDVTTHK